MFPASAVNDKFITRQHLGIGDLQSQRKTGHSDWGTTSPALVARHRNGYDAAGL